LVGLVEVHFFYFLLSKSLFWWTIISNFWIFLYFNETKLAICFVSRWTLKWLPSVWYSCSCFLLPSGSLDDIAEKLLKSDNKTYPIVKYYFSVIVTEISDCFTNADSSKLLITITYQCTVQSERYHDKSLW
jgi:hypothetical protein